MERGSGWPWSYSPLRSIPMTAMRIRHTRFGLVPLNTRHLERVIKFVERHREAEELRAENVELKSG